MLRIPWVDHVTNEQVMQQMQKQEEVVFTVKKRKPEKGERENSTINHTWQDSRT